MLGEDELRDAILELDPKVRATWISFERTTRQRVVLVEKGEPGEEKRRWRREEGREVRFRAFWNQPFPFLGSKLTLRPSSPYYL